MSFVCFDPNGAAVYDTEEAAIERARQIAAFEWSEALIWVQRKYVPLWLAHLLRDTPLGFLAYREVK